MIPTYDHLEDISQKLYDHLVDRLARHSTNKIFGFQIEKLRKNYCCLRLDHREEVTNGVRSRGTIHGGVVTALADTAGAFALSTNFEGQMSFATVDLHISFLARARSTLLAHAYIIRRGSRISVCDVHVADAEGKLVAKATVNFIMTKPPESAG